ncbi:MAG: hypothetical protein U5K84_06310 [Alkalibacterium sp.]|nr:hypothetical protein [Alkalibacterium sp.]
MPQATNRMMFPMLFWAISWASSGIRKMVEATNDAHGDLARNDGDCISGTEDTAPALSAKSGWQNAWSSSLTMK